MAKLEGVKVIEMNNGEVTKVTYNGEEYTKVDGDAEVGDLIQPNSTWDSCTNGAYYECVNLDGEGDACIGTDGGYTSANFRYCYEVFRKVNESTTGKPKGERLKVGDLAKVISDENYAVKRGDIVKVNEDDNVPYVTRISDGLKYALKQSEMERYTPQAGDKLTIDGVEYTLEERSAEVGEKVIVVNTLDNRWENGEIHEAKYDSFGGILIYHEEGLNVTHKKHAKMYDREYIVLSPTTTESEVEAVMSEPTPITFVIKTKTGDTFEVLAEDSDIVTVSAFADEYLFQDEETSLVFLDHVDIFVPYENIASISVKGA